MSNNNNNNNNNIGEYKISKKWDHCLENMLVKAGYGVLISGIAGFVIFRGSTARAFAIGTGFGFGVGRGWMDCRLSFENPDVKLAKFSWQSIPGLSKTDGLKLKADKIEKDVWKQLDNLKKE